jgi:hypothetical protein
VGREESVPVPTVTAKSDKSMRLCTVLTVLFSFFGGCSGGTTADEIVGNWTVRYRETTEELVLRKDGTFDQILADQQDLNLARRSGKWEFRNGQEAQVVLHGGLAIDETTGKVDHELSRAENGLSIFPVRRRFGKIKLIVNEDLNLSFSKSPS